VAAVCAVAALTQPARLRGQTASRLSTVLADLARASALERGSLTTAQATGLPPPDHLPASVRDALRARHLRINPRGEVQIYVLVSDVTDDVRAQLASVGATIEIEDAGARRIQARVPVSHLEALSQLPNVNAVRPPTYARHRSGAKQTEGDSILRADRARQQLGLDGTGVRVGVLSDGVKGVFATGCTGTCGGAAGGPIATGDVPDATGVRNGAGVLTSSSGGITGRSFQADSDLEGLPSGTCSFAGAGAEGTALLEIVHDLAPGATLSFANADTDMAFNNAVNYLASSNDVVVDDLGFFGLPYDGTSTVSRNTANALNNDQNPIRGYFTSVGNSADEHYLGTYTDSGVDGQTVSGITTAGHLHLFQRSGDTTDILGLGAQPYNVISLPTNGEVAIFLTWDDAFGGSSNDYNLYLVRQSNGSVVARSTDTQSGTQDPVEFIDFTNSGDPGLFRIVVQNVNDAAKPKQLNLYSFEPECAQDGPRLLANGRHERHNYNTATRSVSAQSDSGGSPVSVVSVGAICSASAAAAAVFAGSPAPSESCNDRTNSTIEFYSSLGPTIDGRTKPDVSGIDGVSVTGAGGFPRTFFGTSAAAPHVAGIAALVLQAAPCLAGSAQNALPPAAARGRLRSLIVDNADHLGSPIPNNRFGSGRADALASVEKTLPAFKGSSSLTVDGNTAGGAKVSASQLGFRDPTGCTLTGLSWTGGCGTSPGDSLTCPFGTTEVHVRASNNGVTFGDSADIKVTVTNFSVGTSPSTATVAGGTSATYTVTLTAKGGAYRAPVALSCTNLPPLAACSFAPATVTPGTGSAQSKLTISTGTRAAQVLTPTHEAPSNEVQSGPSDPAALPAALAVTGVLVLLVRSRRPPALRTAGVTLACTALVLVPACGGSSSRNNGSLGGGTNGLVTVSPASLTFAAQTINLTSAAQTITLKNGTAGALTISSITANGDFAQSNTCGTSLGASASCSIAVTFTPTAAGTRTGSIVVTDSGAGSPRTVTLTGAGQTGTTPAGTYSIGVSGTAGTLVQSSQVTLTVQ
jgi:hypothetical protein